MSCGGHSDLRRGAALPPPMSHYPLDDAVGLFSVVPLDPLVMHGATAGASAPARDEDACSVGRLFSWLCGSPSYGTSQQIRDKLK